VITDVTVYAKAPEVRTLGARLTVRCGVCVCSQQQYGCPSIMGDPHCTVYTSVAPQLNLRARVGATTVTKLPSEPACAAPDILAREPCAPGAHLRAPGNCAGPVRCIVCEVNMGRYTCPRCLAQYCAVACYQKHGERCTESFYQEHVVDELHSRPVTSEAERREMLAIL
jgi:hypothetical protein